MSICSQETSDQLMRNHHGTTFESILQTLQIWRERMRIRHELAQWSQRDMHDAGISWSEMAAEVEKPFWRS